MTIKLTRSKSLTSHPSRLPKVAPSSKARSWLLGLFPRPVMGLVFCLKRTTTKPWIFRIGRSDTNQVFHKCNFDNHSMARLGQIVDLECHTTKFTFSVFFILSPQLIFQDKIFPTKNMIFLFCYFSTGQNFNFHDNFSWCWPIFD